MFYFDIKFSFSLQAFYFRISALLILAPPFTCFTFFLFVSLPVMAVCRCGDWDHIECLQHPWAKPFNRKVSQLRAFGVRAKLHFRVNDWQFVSLEVDIHPEDRWILLRQTNAWPLHITLFYTWQVSPQLMNAIRKKWDRVYLRLVFGWTGTGGTGYLHHSSSLCQCSLIKRAHRQMHYEGCGLHISF